MAKKMVKPRKKPKEDLVKKHTEFMSKLKSEAWGIFVNHG